MRGAIFIFFICYRNPIWKRYKNQRLKMLRPVEESGRDFNLTFSVNRAFCVRLCAPSRIGRRAVVSAADCGCGH